MGEDDEEPSLHSMEALQIKLQCRMQKLTLLGWTSIDKS